MRLGFRRIKGTHPFYGWISEKGSVPFYPPFYPFYLMSAANRRYLAFMACIDNPDVEKGPGSI